MQQKHLKLQYYEARSRKK